MNNYFKQLFKSRGSQWLLVIFLFMLVWFTVVNIIGLRETVWSHIYSLLLAIVPGMGGCIGLYRMRQWGGYKSIIGKAVFFISMGLVAWSLGSWVWTYYNFFLGVEAPYPSWADIFYFQIYFFWGAGLLVLSNITSVESSGSNLKEKVIFFCIPIVMAIVTYFLLFLDLHGGQLNYANLPKVFVDLYYPLGDVAVLTIIVLSSGATFNFLGERLKLPIMLLIIGFMINYIADFYLAYTTQIGTYYVGSTSDLLFTISMFILSLGLSNLHPKLLKD